MQFSLPVVIVVPETRESWIIQLLMNDVSGRGGGNDVSLAGVKVIAILDCKQRDPMGGILLLFASGMLIFKEELGIKGGVTRDLDKGAGLILEC